MKTNKVLEQIKAGGDVVVSVNGNETHFRYENGRVVRYGGDCRAYGPIEDWSEAEFLAEYADAKFRP